MQKWVNAEDEVGNDEVSCEHVGELKGGVFSERKR